MYMCRGRALSCVVTGLALLGLVAGCGSGSAADESAGAGNGTGTAAAFYPLAWVAEQVGGARVQV
ncbi:MAG: zinc ABC transporter substrate-binding protein, partial [Actinomycetota bacterium]|nr:zinc ABC transporter substrate-binding protein [Actinomycetota bacterium]